MKTGNTDLILKSRRRIVEKVGIKATIIKGNFAAPKLADKTHE
jgi:hypothetical protein